MRATDAEPSARPVGGTSSATVRPGAGWSVFCSLLALRGRGRRRAHLRRASRPCGRAGPDEVVSTVTDPDGPGLRGLPRADADARDPAPQRGGSRSIAVLSLNSGDVGGSVLLVSPEIRGGTEDDSFNARRPSRLRPRSRAAMPALQAQLGFGITEVAVVDDARWAELVAPGGAAPARQPRRRSGPFPAGPDHADGRPGRARTWRRATRASDPRAASCRHRAFYRPGWTRWPRRTIRPRSRARSSSASAGSCAGLRRWTASTSSPCRWRDDGRRRATASTSIADAMAALVAELVPFPTAGSRAGGCACGCSTVPAIRSTSSGPPRSIVPGRRGDRRRRATPTPSTTTETEIRYHDPSAADGGERPPGRPWAPAVWSMILARPTRSMSPSCSEPTCRSDRPG